MTTLFTRTYPRTLHHLPANTRAVWLFENAADRAAVSHRLNIPVYSAYKTLLCTVTEHDLLAGVRAVDLYYPLVEGDDPLRFRLECYPLPDLYAHCHIRFIPRHFPRHARPYYSLHYGDGHALDIPVPVRWRKGGDGRDILAACGWIEYADGRHEALQTDYESLYDDACRIMGELPLTPLQGAGARGPFFERLQLDITLPAYDTPLPLGEEHLSLAEALHEDLYFSGLDIFRHRLDLPAEDRSLTPGQIFPLVRHGAHASLHIHLPEVGGRKTHPAYCSDLDQAGHWLNPEEITAHLQAIGGEVFSRESRQGRPCSGLIISGSGDAALALSAGQHANESSGIVGALRAAYTLKAKGDLHFSLRALGNPDGYAAFAELCQHNPRHMQHAARYTASGCDLAYGHGGEQLLCRDARARLPEAWLHINLHGYPAHEWTVPLSGYVPQGFARWTIPKGYFLICRHHHDFAQQARALMDALLDALAQHEAQMTQNRAMLARYRHSVGDADFAIAHDAIPYMMEARDDGDYPVEIITEAPDETVYGESFRIAHESHYRIIMAAARFLLEHPHTSIKTG